MTHATTYDARLAPTATVDGFLSRVRKAIADRILFSRTRAELSDLSDRELRDLGLFRYDIERVAHRSVYGA